MKQQLKTIIVSNSFLYSLVRKAQRFRHKIRKPISGNNNKVINKGVLNSVKYDIVGNNNLVEIEQGAILCDLLIYIRGDNHKLCINKKCHIKGGSFWFEDHNCNIIIGQSTSIESAHIAVTEPNKSIVIGKDCMFSTLIEFRTGDSHSIIDLETHKRINYAENIEVGDHVWIGANSIILKGVKIGNNSIIGTNSLVTKDIPDHSIVAGIPARIIKYNIDWLRERVYDDKDDCES